ncbi:major facilitator superfamily domain-containing protein [Xylogone sp. PMI_703]|nr:major facilitator superfamily domain-containing protein [Xylogone sp. PMI_703]
MNNLPTSLSRIANFGNKHSDPVLYAPVPMQTLSDEPSEITTYATYHRRRKQIVIVVSCLALIFTGCGINFAFGVYQELYEGLGGPFQDASPGQIDLIGTLSASLMTIGAPIVSAWTKTYGPRSVTMLGGVVFVTASIAASFGTQLWHFVLTQGLLQGCAVCLIYIPAVTVSPAFFNERRGLAMGIITSGTGLGGMAWAPFLRYLMTEVGFRYTLRITGVIAAILIIISASVLEEVNESVTNRFDALNTHNTRHRPNLHQTNSKVIRSNEFIAHASGTALQAAAYMIPVYFMSSYARTLGYSNTAGANIIALSNAFNCGGKIIIGHLADRFGRLNALVLSTFISAGATFGLWCVSNIQITIDTHQNVFIMYACIYGISAGAYVSLFPTALAEQFGIEVFPSISGLLYMIRGIGTLLGAPVGGALIQHSKESRGTPTSFDRSFFLVSVLLTGATLSVMWARTMKASIERKWRV